MLLHRLRHSSTCKRVEGTLSRARFRAQRWAFSVRQRTGSLRSSARAARAITRLAVRPTLTAAVVVSALVLLRHLPPAPGKANTLILWLSAEPDKAVYAAVLTTVAATSGLFLALYFTALSVVASTSYAGVTPAIRSLVVDEVVGSTYLRIIAHLAAVALLALALLGLGAEPSRSVLIYSALLGAVVLFAFFRLGRHIFAFFDPRMLSRFPQREFAKYLTKATTAGRRWAVPSFQKHFHGKALGALRTVDDLIEYASSEAKPRAEVVSGLAADLLNLLAINAQRSSRIPSDSLWFERTAKFERWELLSGVETDIALQTGTGPRAQEVPNHLFITQRIASTIARALTVLFKVDAVQEAAELMVKITSAAAHLGSTLAVSEAFALLDAAWEPLLDYLTKHELKERERRYAALSAVSAMAVGYLQVVLSTTRVIENRSADSVLAPARDLRKRRTKHLYRSRHPRSVLKRMESFHQALRFEREAEGKLVSPDWYLKEIIAQAYADCFADITRQFLAAARRTYLDSSTRFTHVKDPLFAAECLCRGIEAATKLGFRIEPIRQRCQELASLVVNKEGWDLIDFDQVMREVQGLRTALLKRSAREVAALAVVSRDNELPDYLGHTRAVLSQELVPLMSEKDDTDFDVLFGAVFDATLEVASSHVAGSSDPRQTHSIAVALDTSLDLLELSGLALLFSELHGTDFFNIVKARWESYLDNHSSATQAIELFYLAMESRLQLPFGSPGAMARQEWQRSFAQAMANAGFSTDAYSTPWEQEEEARSKHKSYVIQSIHLHLGMMFTDPSTYFAALYLTQRPEASGLKMPEDIRQCISRLEDEKERRQNTFGEEGSGTENERT